MRSSNQVPPQRSVLDLSSNPAYLADFGRVRGDWDTAAVDVKPTVRIARLFQQLIPLRREALKML